MIVTVTDEVPPDLIARAPYRKGPIHALLPDGSYRISLQGRSVGW